MTVKINGVHRDLGSHLNHFEIGTTMVEDMKAKVNGSSDSPQIEFKAKKNKKKSK